MSANWPIHYFLLLFDSAYGQDVNRNPIYSTHYYVDYHLDCGYTSKNLD